jgi:hypothetical protein
VLQGYVEVLADVVVAGDGLQQAIGDAVGVGIEEAQPAQAVDAGESVEQVGETVFQAKVFAVAGGVLADEGNFLDAAGDELLRLGDDRLEAAGTEFAAQVGDDAETARVVAALGDLDVGRGLRGGQVTRGGLVVKIGGQEVSRAFPVVAAEAALLFTELAFGPEGLRLGLVRAGEGFLAGAGVGGGSRVENGERRRSGKGGLQARGFEDCFEFAGADYCVDFWNALADLVAIALDQAAGDDELFG